ncbi:hypothetical protein ACFPH6_10590 [Streptomyces xiangluensis]|uniref:Uncharacterized protein n=1 Tax=Streptomyces xiangluensis TaxID=2665720 RepID=A0ABV8YKY4_9ACTN
MDIRAVVNGFRNVVPLPGLADAWHWSPVPGLDFAAVLSRDRRHFFQIHAPLGLWR